MYDIEFNYMLTTKKKDNPLMYFFYVQTRLYLLFTRIAYK